MFNAIRVSRLVNSAALAALGVAFLVGVSSPLKAETITGNEATVTFDHPVEVPGKVLPAGTYVFKTTDSDELVQVFSADQKHLFATVSVIPADRPAQDTDNDSFIQLNKTRADAPQEIEGLFVAGRTTGFQFIYPVAQTHHRRG
jgi:hypothetical protein